jgi:hypothetical protein
MTARDPAAPHPAPAPCITMFAELDRAPSLPLEPAPLSAWLPVLDGHASALLAFWGTDDRYYVQARTPDAADRWFVGMGPVESLAAPVTEATVHVLRPRTVRCAPVNVTLLRGRAGRATSGERTTILAGRAVRSLRWQA